MDEAQRLESERRLRLAKSDPKEAMRQFHARQPLLASDHEFDEEWKAINEREERERAEAKKPD